MTWHNIPSVGPTFAVPYIFEPIPLPEDLSLEGLEPLPTEEGVDPESLAAMWCLLEEAPPEGSQPWDLHSQQAVDQWGQLEGEYLYMVRAENSHSARNAEYRTIFFSRSADCRRMERNVSRRSVHWRPRVCISLSPISPTAANRSRTAVILDATSLSARDLARRSRRAPR